MQLQRIILSYPNASKKVCMPSYVLEHVEKRGHACCMFCCTAAGHSVPKPVLQATGYFSAYVLRPGIALALHAFLESGKEAAFEVFAGLPNTAEEYQRFFGESEGETGYVK